MAAVSEQYIISSVQFSKVSAINQDVTLRGIRTDAPPDTCPPGHMPPGQPPPRTNVPLGQTPPRTSAPPSGKVGRHI